MLLPAALNSLRNAGVTGSSPVSVYFWELKAAKLPSGSGRS